MSILAFIVGIGLPASCGWLLLRSVEGSTPTLLREERWAAGTVIGISMCMWVMFGTHVGLGIPLSRVGFVGTQLVLLCILGGLWRWRTPTGTTPSTTPTKRTPRWEYAVWALLAIAVAKVIFASVTFLLLTPTYLDDTLDNWNLRGKVFYEDRALTLVMPGEDPETSPKGVSSYPPTVPLLKASLAAIAGEWSEPLVNSVHAVWYACAAVLVYATIRRRYARRWALLTVYGFLSMPLGTMHGTNAYADVFVSVHVFLAALWTLDALQESDPASRRSRFALASIAFAALTFTKNEGLIVYLPPLLLITALGVAWAVRQREILVQEAISLLARVSVPLVVFALPWLVFKWSHGLTFGNAKPFSTFDVYWRDGVLLAVGVNTFFEGNWLFLFPLLFTLLAWRWRAAWKTYLPLSAFFAIVYVGQMTLFLFTNLSVEATMQTGYARGIVQLLPTIVVLTGLLVADAFGGQKTTSRSPKDDLR